MQGGEIAQFKPEAGFRAFSQWCFHEDRGRKGEVRKARSQSVGIGVLPALIGTFAQRIALGIEDTADTMHLSIFQIPIRKTASHTFYRIVFSDFDKCMVSPRYAKALRSCFMTCRPLGLRPPSNSAQERGSFDVPAIAGRVALDESLDKKFRHEGAGTFRCRPHP